VPVFDAERAWHRLKAEVVSKPSHGKRDLLATMVEIELECTLDDHERNFDSGPVAWHEPAEVIST
jgi:hypothetical protein